MEVTRENFDAVFTRLEEDFKKAQFIALDTEFTGLKVEGASGLNYYDTLEDFYLKDRLKAETFMAIQVGIVMFMYDNETNKYSHLAYNFYVYPSSFSDINFTCQSKSIQFLIENGFDFNKLFKYGIPYLRNQEAEKLIERLSEKFEKNNSEHPLKVDVPDEHQKTISSIITKIQDILKSKGKMSFNTEKYNSFVRRIIYNTVKMEFGSNVLLEPNKDETITISVGFTPEEVKEKQKEKLNAEKNKITNEIGFSKVIKLLIDSKKLIVGHNLFLDILFIIRQFLVPLPDTYTEFKELVKFVFPNIIDTKHMASVEMNNIKDTSLNSLAEYFENSCTFPEVLVDKSWGVGHKVEEKKMHEASYDAYLTGLCFLAMIDYKGMGDCYKNLPNSLFIQRFLNKLSIPKLFDIPYMNLGGVDNEPDRRGVYHLTFPKEWTRDNIMVLFKNFGFVNISWINSTSAFVKVNPEYTKEVERSLIKANNNYKLVSYSKFKSTEGALNPAKEPDVENSVNAESPVKLNFNETIKKRKIEEDIGEVIERPQKKRCSQ